MHTAWQKLIDNLHAPGVTACQASRTEDECRRWMCLKSVIVLFITFEAIALTTVPASWCPLHDLNAKGQRLAKTLGALAKHMCFWSLPRTSIFGYTEHTSIIEFGQIWCYDLWRESRTYFAELHAGFDRSFFLVFILQNWNFITIRVLNYLIIAFSHEVGYSRNRLARKRANFERRF